MCIMYACALAQTALLLSKPRDKSYGVVLKRVLGACRFIPRLESRDYIGQKAHRLSEPIYVKATETTCSSDELCLFKEEEHQQIVSLGDSRIEHVGDRLDMLIAAPATYIIW